jgi:malate dehydrogenase (quinone)
MVELYCKQYDYLDTILQKVPKMALGVGDEEVAYIKQRQKDFAELFPYMEYWDKEKLAQIEPKLLEGRDPAQDIAAMGVMDHYSAIDFGALSKTFVKNAQKANPNAKILFNSEVKKIKEVDGKFVLKANKEEKIFDFVIVDAGAHSLLLAHRMGYGQDLSCLPIGGSFFYGKHKMLKSKVYTVQNPKLPFAAVHGDPDIMKDGIVRFGPTALTLPKLERYHHAHFVDFLESLSPSKEVFEVFFDLMGDSDIRQYILKNFMYEIPGVRREKFVKQEINKIVPSMGKDDIYFAKGVGGLRPQVIDKTNKKLMLGEAKINPGNGIIFNMTPSPGATSCLGNAFEDSKLACEFLGCKFDEEAFKAELSE